MKLVPESNNDDNDDNSSTTKYLDERMLETPSIAFGNTLSEILRMGKKAETALESSFKGFIEKDNNAIDKTFEYENTINQLRKGILNYLLKLSKSPLNDDERFKTDLFFNTVNDIERLVIMLII